MDVSGVHDCPAVDISSNHLNDHLTAQRWDQRGPMTPSHTQLPPSSRSPPRLLDAIRINVFGRRRCCAHVLRPGRSDIYSPAARLRVDSTRFPTLTPAVGAHHSCSWAPLAGPACSGPAPAAADAAIVAIPAGPCVAAVAVTRSSSGSVSEDGAYRQRQLLHRRRCGAEQHLVNTDGLGV